jgi:hypothetical protein
MRCLDFYNNLKKQGWYIQRKEGSVLWMASHNPRIRGLQPVDLRYDTAIKRPTGDGATIEWTTTNGTGHYAAINDVVTQPSTSIGEWPGGHGMGWIDSNNVTSGTKTDIQTYTSEITSSAFSNFTLWGWCDCPSLYPHSFTPSIYVNGAWVAGSLITLIATAAWYSSSFSGSWVQADEAAFSSKVVAEATKFGNAAIIMCLYAFATYTPPVTFKPKITMVS